MATVAPSRAVAFGQSSPPKKLRHKASTPIITWLSKKLGGSHSQRPQKTALGTLNTNISANTTENNATVRGRTLSLQVAPTSEPAARTVVLNDDQDLPSPSARRSIWSERNSLAAESTWTKKSALEADDDASIRPLPPTSPPSPTPSRSSSSQVSDLRTFRSGAASTKPTTLMSVDSGTGAGLITGTMAHIAQVPVTNSSPSTSTNAPNSRYATPLVHPAVARAASRHRSPMQAPLHTHHHPRNNPNPMSPPADNASTLTLASSAFAASGRANDWGDGMSLSLDQYQPDADVNSSHTGLDDDDVEVAASVRALRPRSSRRGSWESEASRWSARVGSGTQGIGSPSIVSGMTRPPSVGDQSVTRSLSIGRLRIGLEATDESSLMTPQSPQPKEGDEDEEGEEHIHKDGLTLITHITPSTPTVEGNHLSEPGSAVTNTPSVRLSLGEEPRASSSPA
ncbi:hypothetical protein FS842_002179 [Serendipita sp. 407]|nr:hypothetical protein FS842_002179 [Serendipita sp. 407]